MTITAWVIGLFLFVAAMGSFYTVNDGYVGVVSTFGEYNDSETTPGLAWKFPFVQSVDKMDVKMQTVNYKRLYQAADPDDAEDDGVRLMPQISILDSKNLPIGIDLTVQYTPVGSEMSAILRTYGMNYFDRKINPIIRASVRDVASQYDAENIARKREEIGRMIKANLTKEFEKLPFTLNDIALRNIILPPTVAEKVKQVQEAKQEEQRLAMVEKQAVVDKRIAVIKAQKEAEVRFTKAEGEARAITVKADAQAKANRKVASSLTELLVKQNQIERWDGVVAKYQLGTNTSMLMSVPQDK